jgi:hypothetical protein
MSDRLLLEVIALLLTLGIIVIGVNIRQRRSEIEWLTRLLEQSQSHVARLEAVGIAICQAATAFISQLNCLTAELAPVNQKLATVIQNRTSSKDAVAALELALGSISKFIHSHSAIFAAFGVADRLREFDSARPDAFCETPALGVAAPHEMKSRGERKVA